MLKVAGEIEKQLLDFDMIYPFSNIAGFVKRLFPIIDKSGYNNAGIHLGLRSVQLNELMYVRSYGIGGLDIVNEGKSLVPNALRWMVSNNDINWRRAFTAVMMDNALGKDK